MNHNLSRLMETAIREINAYGTFEQPNVILSPMNPSHWRPVGKYAPTIRDTTMQALKRRGFVEIDGRFARLTDAGKEKANELKKGLCDS